MNSKRLIILLGLIGLASAQYKWERLFGGTGRDQAFAVAVASDSGYIAAGLSASFPSKCYEMYLVKTGKDGDSAWSYHYGTANNDYCWSIAGDPAGGYLLLGATDSTLQTGPHDVYLVKIGETGDSLWSRVYGDTSDGPLTNDVGHCIKACPGGGYIIVGSTESYGAGAYDFYALRVTAAGDTLWTRTYGTSGAEYGQTVLPLADSGYLIGGTGYAASQQIMIVRVHAGGDTAWTRTYGGAGSENVTGIVQSGDQGFYLVGSTTSSGAGGGDLYLVKIDAAGNLLWDKTFGGPYPDWGNAIVKTADNGYVMTGGTRTSPNPEDCAAWLLKVDAAGNLLWSKTKAPPAGSANGMDVQPALDQGFIVAAIAWEPQGDDDFWLVKTDSEGNSIREEFKYRTADALPVPAVFPNPFVRYLTVVGRGKELYDVYAADGRAISTYPADRVGADLAAGVYFLVPRAHDSPAIRCVKVR